MSTERIALEHYQGRGRLADAISSLSEQVWRRVDPGDLDGSWARLGPQLVVGVAGAQLGAARTADDYVDAALEAQGIDLGDTPRLNPSTLAGIASDGRRLDSLLQSAVTVVKSGIASGATLDRAMAAGLANLDLIARTQVGDAGRAADGVAIAARPQIGGYVRVLVGKSCSRCAILAGRRYRWNDGFLRHPRCNCIHVPAAEGAVDELRTSPRRYFNSLSTAEQDKTFTKAGAAAIREGSDPARVVNARRGMYEAGGKRLTTEATTARGIDRRIRLMPEQIYREARGDRDEAIRLLRSHGYITGRAPGIARRPVPAAPQPARPLAPRVASAAAAPARVRAGDQLDRIAADLNADPSGFAARVAQAKSAGYDVHLRAIGERQGFGALPRVGTRAELDAAIASGSTETWRGVMSHGDMTAAQINARLRTGVYEPGRGVYGNGYYVSERRMSAETYRGHEPRSNFPAGGGPDFELSDLEGDELPDSMLRIALDPGARVADYDKLLVEQKAWLAGQPDGPAKDALSDVGRYAAARGYDVLRIDAKHPDGSYYPGWEDDDDEVGGAVQWAVLNRAVMLIQRAEDVP